jgi:hypothetical protein
MLVQRAYKTELDLNDRQVTACRQRWREVWTTRETGSREAGTER